MRRRLVYEVEYCAPLEAWVLKRRGGRIIGTAHETKARAVAAGMTKCRRRWLHGGRSQLVIRLQDGSIQEERTYPDTTPRRRG